ncbi:MAG: Rnase Y domain-containing protein, partial [Actinomycetota bacterium]|nr:Rnase Y domain-containing protein [Actinomycetota bacterium]
MLTVVAALIGILIGAIGAAVCLLVMPGSRVRAAETARERILADAERDAETMRRESQVEAREQAVHLRSEIEAEVQDKRLEIVKIEERALQKEEEIDARLIEIERREQGLGDREVHAKALQEELKEAKDEALVALERLSGLTVHEAKQQLLERST